VQEKEDVFMQEIIYTSLGETIRQMRRQQGLTQSELGDEHFSKSYISAVERDKIVPSYEAMRFFAQQLGQSIDYFENLYVQNENAKHTSSKATSPAVYMKNEQAVEEKVLPLLDTLLEGAECYISPALRNFLPLTPDAIAEFSNDVQGRYAFLLGLLAQQKQEFSAALESLERALALAPQRYRPVILNALGTNFYYQQSYYTALDYHKRALVDLEALNTAENDTSEKARALRLKIEFNCGNDYHAIGAHHQACEHYEQARKLLHSTHDIKTAAQLYLNLGYCIYADVYSSTIISPFAESKNEEIEREFSRAVSYFVQSRTLYQVIHDRRGEASARLSQAMVLLDLSTHRWKVAEAKAQRKSKVVGINCATLLDEAEEQCCQILLAFEPTTSYPSSEVENLLYTALAYLVRVATQRATLAHIENYAETATREASVAAHLCQQVLDTLSEQAFPWTLLRAVSATKERTFTVQTPTLPRVESALHTEFHHAVSRSVVLFAAGEVAEMIGHSTTQDDYAEACYERANQCFLAALGVYGTTSFTQEHDISYLYRAYLRCIETLEERNQLKPEIAEKTNSVLLHMLKDAIQTSSLLAL
jgi:tetratricopeptide (TPR) repeat protein